MSQIVYALDLLLIDDDDWLHLEELNWQDRSGKLEDESCGVQLHFGSNRSAIETQRSALESPLSPVDCRLSALSSPGPSKTFEVESRAGGTKLGADLAKRVIWMARRTK